MWSTATSSPILDSTAYPHVLDVIIEQTGAVSTLIAFRSVSHRCKKLADAKLFRHVTLRRESHQPRSRGLAAWLLWRTDPPARKRRSILVPSTMSGIDPDRALPPMLDKVDVLDLVGAEAAEHKSYEFVARRRELRAGERSRRTELDGCFAAFAPRVLRRFGRSPQEDWGRVLDTTVDFVAPPGGKDYRNFRSVKVPLVTPRYVLHLDLPSDGVLDDFFAFHYAWERYDVNVKRDVRDVSLVLSPHCAPDRAVVEGAIVRVATQFMGGMMDGRTSLTVVGLDGWLPGVSPAEFVLAVEDAAVAACLADWRRPRPFDPDVMLVRRAYEGIRFITLHEWWDELGDMKDLVGVSSTC